MLVCPWFYHAFEVKHERWGTLQENRGITHSLGRRVWMNVYYCMSDEIEFLLDVHPSTGRDDPLSMPDKLRVDSKCLTPSHCVQRTSYRCTFEAELQAQHVEFTHSSCSNSRAIRRIYEASRTLLGIERGFAMTFGFVWLRVDLRNVRPTGHADDFSGKDRMMDENEKKRKKTDRWIYEWIKGWIDRFIERSMEAQVKQKDRQSLISGG